MWAQGLQHFSHPFLVLGDIRPWGSHVTFHVEFVPIVRPGPGDGYVLSQGGAAGAHSGHLCHPPLIGAPKGLRYNR